MKSPNNDPMLFFPCGHTFCEKCIRTQKEKLKQFICPFCRVPVVNYAVNVALKSLINSFVESKEKVSKGKEIDIKTRGNTSECEAYDMYKALNSFNVCR